MKWEPKNPLPKYLSNSSFKNTNEIDTEKQKERQLSFFSKIYRLIRRIGQTENSHILAKVWFEPEISWSDF